MTKNTRNDRILVLVFFILSTILFFSPTGFEDRIPQHLIRAKGEVLSVDNSDVGQFGMVRTGGQDVTLKILDGQFQGQTFETLNNLLGQMDRDKLFVPGDTALVVFTLKPDGTILTAVPQDYYRLDLELMLMGLFALLLLAYGGWTGFKALLSFVFAGMALWKILVPMLLMGYDPVLVSFGVVSTLSAVIIFLVAGPTMTGIVAFLGALSGVLSSCGLAWYFTDKFHLSGVVMPFAETLLYSGYGHLNLVEIFISAVFLASSGAVMDLAMDVSASLNEVVSKKPGIGFTEALGSGLRVGRAVVGTMTTTLLLAYSGGFLTLLMAFVAQGVPLANTFNLVYVAAEVLKTLVGSFGLVLVGPLTAFIGAFLFTWKK